MSKETFLDIIDKRIKTLKLNSDIKEILNGLNVAIKHESSVKIDFRECKKIVDYITYLQEENKKSEQFRKSLIHMNYGIGGLHHENNKSKGDKNE